LILINANDANEVRICFLKELFISLMRENVVTWLKNIGRAKDEGILSTQMCRRLLPFVQTASCSKCPPNFAARRQDGDTLAAFGAM
jgi:hypothetical protein